MISCNNLVTSMAVEAWVQQQHAAKCEQRALNARVKKQQQSLGITLGGLVGGLEATGVIFCHNLVTSMAVEAWLQQQHAAKCEQRALNA